MFPCSGGGGKVLYNICAVGGGGGKTLGRGGLGPESGGPD